MMRPVISCLKRTMNTSINGQRMQSNKTKKSKTNATLCIDIGGTNIKMVVITEKCDPLTEYLCVPTPQPATVTAICRLLRTMLQQIDIPFQRATVGFPGVTRQGVVYTAFNLHHSWIGTSFQKKLEQLLECPVCVTNDADLHGYGAVTGQGVELVITLGTGVGSALFIDGHLVPNLELGHHVFFDNQTYEDVLGKAALLEQGDAVWRANLKKAIAVWQKTFNFDNLYLGGGYSYKVTFKLPQNVKVFSNMEGILGGISAYMSRHAYA